MCQPEFYDNVLCFIHTAVVESIKSKININKVKVINFGPRILIKYPDLCLDYDIMGFPGSDRILIKQYMGLDLDTVDKIIGITTNLNSEFYILGELYKLYKGVPHVGYVLKNTDPSTIFKISHLKELATALLSESKL